MLHHNQKQWQWVLVQHPVLKQLTWKHQPNTFAGLETGCKLWNLSILLAVKVDQFRVPNLLLCRKTSMACVPDILLVYILCWFRPSSTWEMSMLRLKSDQLHRSITIVLYEFYEDDLVAKMKLWDNWNIMCVNLTFLCRNPR
jgi:hypothetical protein